MTTLTLTLSADALDALRELGITDPPAQVRVTHREASGRERERFQKDQQKGGAALADPNRWVAGLLARRADVADERVLLELVRDMGPTEIAQHVAAYHTGVMPDPKVVQKAVSGTLTGMTNRLLGVLATANTPSSDTSTPSAT